MYTIPDAIRLADLARYEEIDRIGREYLDRHPQTPRRCYTCQTWLDGAAQESAHLGHSIH